MDGKSSSSLNEVPEPHWWTGTFLDLVAQQEDFISSFDRAAVPVDPADAQLCCVGRP